ncbi:exported hypothetical protein [Candidatus Zixiibacteriota bacterium]|nr:exported hypothetical protein [candidate division Zixibacteria bacterium]
MRNLLLLLAFIISAVSARAQIEADDFFTLSPCPETNRACFRGRPLPECKEFWLVEERLEFRANDVNSLYNPASVNLGIDLGHMFNITRRYAVGGSVYFAANSNRTVEGLRLRYRYWLNRETSFDISPGIIFAGNDESANPPNTKYPGLIISAALGYKDLIAFNLTLERYALRNNFGKIDSPKSETVIYSGFTLGSYSALAGMVATVFTGVIALVSMHEHTVVTF